MAESQPPQSGQQSIEDKENSVLFISEKNKKLRNLFLDLYQNLTNEQLFAVHKKVVSFLLKLKDKYPDYKDREVFHILASSSISSASAPEVLTDDFPGDDSVEKFLNELKKEYKPSS